MKPKLIFVIMILSSLLLGNGNVFADDGLCNVNLSIRIVNREMEGLKAHLRDNSGKTYNFVKVDDDEMEEKQLHFVTNVKAGIYTFVVANDSTVLDNALVKIRPGEENSIGVVFFQSNRSQITCKDLSYLSFPLKITDEFGNKLNAAEVKISYLEDGKSYLAPVTHPSESNQYVMSHLPEGTYRLQILNQSVIKFDDTLSFSNSLRNGSELNIVVGSAKDTYFFSSNLICPYTIDPKTIALKFGEDQSNEVWELCKKLALNVPSIEKFETIKVLDGGVISFVNSKTAFSEMNSSTIKSLRESPLFSFVGLLITMGKGELRKTYGLSNKIDVGCRKSINNELKDYCNKHDIVIEESVPRHYVLTVKPEIGSGIFEIVDQLRHMYDIIDYASPQVKEM